MKLLNVLVAPSGFKESLAAEPVADYIAAGVARALPGVRVIKAPLVDGGEGFTRALVRATGGTLHDLEVTGPVGEPVRAQFGFLGRLQLGESAQAEGRTAVVEMAAAAGLRLVPPDARDPLKTTTYGVGELIAAALDAGADRVLVGCGDSGTNDAGAGLAQALGFALLDEDGEPLPRGGEHLPRLARIDDAGRHPRLADAAIDVACNVHNVLTGPRGVARVFGPQKGASEEDVERLAAAMDHWADVLERDRGVDVRTIPGGGASGGLGSALHALLGGTLHPRYEIVMRYLEFDGLLEQVDLVLTAEGSLDVQTPRGKIPAEVAQRAKQRGLPVIALAGTLGQGARVTLEAGIDAYASIINAPTSLPDAIERAGPLLEDAAEQAMRMVHIGQHLADGERAAGAP